MDAESNSVLNAGILLTGAAAKHTTSTALAAAGGATMVTAAVMAATMPKRNTDFFLCILSTLISSLSIGSYIVLHFDLIGDILLAPTSEHVYMILAQIGGIFFVSGLPGWTLVRSFFVWSESHRKSSLSDIIEDTKRMLKK